MTTSKTCIGGCLWTHASCLSANPSSIGALGQMVEATGRLRMRRSRVALANANRTEERPATEGIGSALRVESRSGILGLKSWVQKSKMETTMNSLKLLTAASLLTAALPLGAANAQGRGWGPCTPAAGMAVGVAGPAMNGGQLMAGVGQCAPVNGWDNAAAYGNWGGYWQPRAIRPPGAAYGALNYGGGYPY